MTVNRNSTALSISPRQRRMLQDMGIDVFTTRQPQGADATRVTSDQAVQLPQPPSKGSSNEAPPPKVPVPTSVTHEGIKVAAHAQPESSAPVAEQNVSQVQVTIGLSVVITPSLVHVGETPLSVQELRFLQDLANAVHWSKTQTMLSESVRNTDFRWPIVEASGTPERAIAMFCNKHELLSAKTVVLITTAGLGQLAPWINDDINHWHTLDSLAEASSQGLAKRALWQHIALHHEAALGDEN